MGTDVQFRGRRLQLRAEKLGPDLFLAHEILMRDRGYMVSLEFSEPMRERLDNLWRTPDVMPDGLSRLQDLWQMSDHKHLSLCVIEQMLHFNPKGTPMPLMPPLSYRRLESNPVTEDGHVYFSAIVTCTGLNAQAAEDDIVEKGLMAVLFPRNDDASGELLRPLGFFVTGEVTAEQCDNFLKRLVLVFEYQVGVRAKVDLQ